MQYKQTEWDFSKFMPALGSDEYEKYIAQLVKDVDNFTKRRSELSAGLTDEQFLEIFNQDKEISVRIAKAHIYTYLLTSKNMKDDLAKKEDHKLEQLSSDFANKMRFFTHWFVHLSSDVALRFAKAAGDDEYHLTKLHEEGKHILPEEHENLLSIKDSSLQSGLENVYNLIESSWEFELDGKKYSFEHFRKLMQNPDRQIRKKVWTLINKKLAENIDVLFSIYVALMTDHQNEAIKLRKYQTTQEAALISEGFSQKALEALTKVSLDHPFAKNFFEVKQKMLKVERMEFYDIIASVDQIEEKIPFQKAMQIITAAIGQFDPAFVQKINDLAASGRIDSVLHPNKRGGAYNYGVPNDKPFVFMQYQDLHNDLHTLAHELGHAIHSCYTMHLSIVSNHASIGVCESMSTLFEEIVFEYDFSTAPKQKQISMLSAYLTDRYATLQRQALISAFELKAHALISEGTTKKDLTNEWVEMYNKLLSPVITLPNDTHAWAAIPHIFEKPFYCYNYTLGNIISLLILDMYKKDKNSTIKKLHEYMSLGGTAGVIDSAKVMGIDLENPQTFIRAYDILTARVEELKKLIA